MGLETMFRIFAVDNTGKHHYTKEQVHSICKEELKHECGLLEKSDEELEEILKKEGYPPFVEVRNPPNADSKKYHYLPDQKEDPFPIWIDTESGNEAYEIAQDNFLSDFDSLYKELRLDTSNFKCCNISVDAVKDMLTVLDYIIKGKYNLDLEEMVFQNNDYFRVFEDQFFNFKMRFRTTKKPPQQIIKIVIKDDRAEAYSENAEDDYDDDVELQEERKESERNERFLVQRLRDVLSAFLVCKEASYLENPKVIYKLGYFLSY